MTTILAFLFVLGVLIFVHELGHFLAARRLGVRVLTFSLGFGPKILKFKRGDTEYCVSIVPLGGYVKMAGESPEDPRSGQPDEFLSKTKWERFQILIMGPVMNIVLAVIALAIVLAQGAEIPAYIDAPPVVGGVQPKSPAEQAGLRAGDRILTVGGDEIATWEALDTAIALRPNRDVPVTVMRDGNTTNLTVHPKGDRRFEIGDIGVLPDTYPVVRTVEPDLPAGKEGVKPGDVIVSVNGARMITPQQVVDAISPHEGQPVDITFRRDGSDYMKTLTPVKSGGIVRVGIGPAPMSKTFKPGPVEAFKLSVVRNYQSSGMIFRILGGLFTGETSVRQLQGPVGIAQLSGESARLGWVALLSLMAVISLNLGILNLMPIPVLDGGHILIMALEGVARRDFSMQVKEKMLLVGFALLMVLMVTVIYNDLTRISWLERLMPWRQ